MPSYKGQEWSDESYDAIDHLIDNDPIELGALTRSLLAAVRHVDDAWTEYVSEDGDDIDVPAHAIAAARSVVDAFDTARGELGGDKQ